MIMMTHDGSVCVREIDSERTLSLRLVNAYAYYKVQERVRQGQTETKTVLLLQFGSIKCFSFFIFCVLF